MHKPRTNYYRRPLRRIPNGERRSTWDGVIIIGIICFIAIAFWAASQDTALFAQFINR